MRRREVAKKLLAPNFTTVFGRTMKCVGSVTLFVLIASTILVAGCNWEDDPVPGEDGARHQSPLINGNVESGFPNVGAFLLTPPDGESHTCTGTLIADNWVLSSAGCLTGAAPAYIDFVTGGDTSSPDATYPVTQVFAHPSYDPDTTQNDIALAYVHGVQATSPPSYNCASLSGYGSSSVTKVGYGAGNAEPLTGIGIKRRASMEIGGIDQSSIGYQFDGTGPCHGDAGAPSLLEMSGSERLVGLTSTFADGCVGSSSDTRVDAYCNWIQGRLGEDAPDECRLLADECGDDTCVPVAEDAAYCVASEGVGADTACDPADTDWSDGLACADGLVCASVDADTDACRPICTKDADCADDEECVTPIFGVDTAGACLPCTDADEDGFCEDVDCDDSQADINPDAIEVCDDDLDNDCNGDVDGDDPACQTPGDTGVDAGADVGPDAGRDTGTQPDIGDKGATGGDKGGTDGGCNCTSGGPATPAGPVMLVLAGLVALRTRRR